MRLAVPYKQINKLIEQETFESTFTWGLRMAVSVTVPIIWGALTGRIEDAVWMALAAEGICFVELRGSFSQGLRVLVAGMFLAFVFSVLGSITGTNIWLSVIGMLLVGFISGLFKNLGDRGSNLAVSVFVVYIISNAFPTHTTPELVERMLLVLAGGAWTVLVGMIITASMPAQEPYRRTVGVIWKAIAGLTATISHGWDGKTLKSSIRDIYLKEKEVRMAIDSSLHFYETLADQVNRKDKHKYNLAQVRKATSLVAAHINAISEELENLHISDKDISLKLKLYDVLKSLQQTTERMAVFVITLKPEDKLLVSSRINRLQQLIIVLKDYTPVEDSLSITLGRIAQLAERCIKLTESCIIYLDEMGEDLPAFRSYSLFKTLFILHPKHWTRNLGLLFNFNTLTTKYALRSAIAAAVAMFINKWFNVDHGYWIPFTVIIVLQPYFGATFKKAIDRVTGTVLGGLAGGLFLRLNTGLWVEILLLFVCLVFMIYYLRRRYSVGAFFITIVLIILFNIEMPVAPSLIYVRAFSTMGGAALAIIAGFALLPTWDKKSLPVYLAKAINYNYEYFNHTFFSSTVSTTWTRYKRLAESNNSNAFDSFSRYIQEPGLKKKNYAVYYQVLAHNVRVTRELNNINIERENNTEYIADDAMSNDKRIEMCLYWFQQTVNQVKHMMPVAEIHTENQRTKPAAISQQQMIYLDRMIVELKSMQQDLEKLKLKDAEATH